MKPCARFAKRDSTFTLLNERRRPMKEGELVARLRIDLFAYRWTTGHVSVRVIPSTPWMRATTSLPRSSTFFASARTITSYGPVTSSAESTPLICAAAFATDAALPTSVWIRMYAWTTEPPPPVAAALPLAAMRRILHGGPEVATGVDDG